MVREGITPPGRSADRPASAEKGAESFKAGVIKTLRELDEIERDKTIRHGEPGINYSSLIKRVEDRLLQTQSIPDIYDVLFEEGVSPGVVEVVREKSAVSLTGETFGSHVKRRFFGKDNVAAIAENYKSNFGGQAWLENFVEEQIAQKHLTLETAHGVQALARDAAQLYGPSAAVVTRLMYLCSGNQLEGKGDSRSADIAKLERVVSARLKEANTAGQSHENFFVDMQRFFAVYTDITAQVIDTAATPDMKIRADKASKRALSLFLRAQEFQSAHWEEGTKAPNPFDVFRRMLLDDREVNPWILGDGRETPFDVGKFGLLISEDVPRGLVAESVRFLNNYKIAMLAQDADYLLKSAHKIQREIRGGGTLPGSLDAKVKQVLAKMEMLGVPATPPPEKTEQKMQSLTDFVSKHLVYSHLEGGIHPFSVLLRTADPKKILNNDRLKEEFIRFLGDIPKVEPHPDPDGSAGRKIAIVAASVKEFLSSDDPHMDIPLSGVERDPSLRMLLETRAQQWFDAEVLARGPYAHAGDRRGKAEAPLFIPRDVADLTESQKHQLAKNFDTAKGVDTNSKRSWISNACAIWNDMSNSYENIFNFTMRQAEKFYSMQNKYALTFYPSATAAMNDVVSRLFPPITPDDYILISNQEFDGMTEAFTNHGAKVEAVEFNDRARGKAKSIGIILQEFTARIEARGRSPSAVLLSSKTRFGDALGVAEGWGTPNSFGLGDLISKFKEKHPGVAVIVDGCQSVGRNDRGENTLERLGCDIFVNSGAKALGVENVAMLAIRKILEKETSANDMAQPDAAGRDWLRVGRGDRAEHWLSHIKDEEILKTPTKKLSPGKSTVDIRRIGALGIAFQTLSSRMDTWKFKPGEKPRTQRERVAEHMQDLTRYTIEKAKQYAGSLLTHPDFPFSVQINDAVIAEPSVQEQFGCKIVYPVHRKQSDYNGILTLTFPNLGTTKYREGTDELVRSEYIKTELHREGFLAEQCLAGQNAMRISFHYLHEREDIDALFDAVVKIHITFLKKEMQRNRNIDSFAGVVKLTPNTPDTWMEN